MSTTPLQRNYLEELRAIIFSEFAALSWARLPEHLRDLDFVWQAPRESDSKPRYVKRSLKETPDDEIIRVARWYVGNHSSTDEIEDLLEWLKSKGKQTLSDITRREVLEAVEGRHLAGRVEIQELMNLAGASLPKYGGFRSVVQDGSGLYTEDICEEQMIIDFFRRLFARHGIAMIPRWRATRSPSAIIVHVFSVKRRPLSRSGYWPVLSSCAVSTELDHEPIRRIPMARNAPRSHAGPAKDPR
ncbi:MAG: hypothetical protein QOH41_266 [Blastocatellia bacterium]|jgi:hypothetical protein|nr:hypothetical protein [Blastocatellia bacterium]